VASLPVTPQPAGGFCITATDLVSYHRPSQCGLRLYLRHRGEREEASSEFEQLLSILGKRHEANHLSCLGAHINIDSYPEEERVIRTKDAVNNNTPVIYQGRLTAGLQIAGQTVQVVGQPDFLLAQQSGYRIRDSKISLRINERITQRFFSKSNCMAGCLSEHLGCPQLHSRCIRVEAPSYRSLTMGV
jgi:predicted RecB family nuclease